MWILLVALVAIIGVLLKYLNRDYYLLAACKRLRTVDGSKLETKVQIIPGKTIFGNNLDLINATSESAFRYARSGAKQSKGRAFVLHFLLSPIYNVTNAEDAEEVLQSQALITKSRIYKLIEPFMGKGLLISTDELWHSRRKLLTPAFHFNILQAFLEVFKEESQRTMKTLREIENGIVKLNDVIPQFTLNSICETQLGIKLDDIPGSVEYRNAVNSLEPLLVTRLCNPILYFDSVYKHTAGCREEKKLLKIVHGFSSQIIEKKRNEFKKSFDAIGRREKVNEYGRKQRYAMLDTLLDAEMQNLIDHQGICDEVNTFMFEGYDTTSVCLIFSLVNLTIHQDVQEKCYKEIQNLASLEKLSIFDYTNLEYLECVIKETLRLYPSVPFLARRTVNEITINGLILPQNAAIHIHTFDIMRDERHFPEPNRFDPDRFLPENTTNRHPFAFIPFSAGPRNCIGQKFAMLEIKVLLVAILRSFSLQPISRLDDITFENGLILRTKEKLRIKVVPREE